MFDSPVRGRGVVAALVLLLIAGALPARAQESSASETAKLAAARLAIATKELSGGAANDGAAALKAADALVKAAVDVAAASTKAAEAAKNASATVDAVKAAAATAVAASQKMATAASAASSAAGIAAGKVVREPAASNAGKALAAAMVAAKDMTAANEAAQKAGATAAAATALAPAQTATTTVAEETAKAATAGAAMALAVETISREALSPALPVLGERDEHVLAAIRARITGGAIFFNGPTTTVRSADGTSATLQSNQFSQAATYLAFESQPRLFSGPRLVGVERDYERVYLDPFVNVRLTTIPIAGARPETTTITAPSQAFLQSQKAVQLQIGAVASVNFGGFEVQDTQFHWGIGPTYRFMFQNVTDSQRALRLWDLDNDLFKLHSAGMRATIYQQDPEVGDSNWHGWIPAAYLDVSLGKFENFEKATPLTPEATSCLRTPAQCLAREDGVPPREAWDVTSDLRWYLEGRVHLKYLYLGFDLNTGDGPDDLRFIGGLTVRLSQFFTRRE
jgi:hypothetical protein